MTSGVGLRALKKQLTRDTIAHAALKLAADKGLERLTIEQIAELAFVSPRTVSNYFAGKEEAIMAAGSAWRTSLPAAVLARPVDEPPLEAMRRGLVDSFRALPADQLDLHRDKHELTDRYPSLRPYALAAYDDLEAALRQTLATRYGRDSNDLGLSLAAGVAVVAFRAAIRHWAAGTTGHSMDELLEEAFGQLGRGLAPTQAVRPAA